MCFLHMEFMTLHETLRNFSVLDRDLSGVFCFIFFFLFLRRLNKINVRTTVKLNLEFKEVIFFFHSHAFCKHEFNRNALFVK